VLDAWRLYSEAMDQYPYHGSVVYTAPHHRGSANLLWSKPTGYQATMVGIPYDDLESWRGVYPGEVLADQFEKVADGFRRGRRMLRTSAEATSENLSPLELEANVGETAEIQFRSAANQARFVMLRDELAAIELKADAEPIIRRLETIINAEMDLAIRLHALQSRDSRLGFEATNHYFFTPMDLAEKVLNCRWLLDHWLPQQRSRFEDS
jgi:hypothetical protein